jgi:hypothetical protein
MHTDSFIVIYSQNNIYIAGASMKYFIIQALGICT